MTDSTGAALPLVTTGLAGITHVETVELTQLVVLVLLRETEVHHHFTVIQSQRRLPDVGGHHHFPKRVLLHHQPGGLLVTVAVEPNTQEVELGTD